MAMKTVIEFSLDSKSIGNAIKQLEAYQDDFKRKCEMLRQKVADRIRWSAEQGFSAAIVSDVIGKVAGKGKIASAEQPPNDVTVSVEHGKDFSIVIAKGSQAVFIEYGAGVYHNGAPGDSPHPWGIQQGFAIGAYPENGVPSKGVRNVWGYKDGSDIVLTHGTPAAMPMYRGAEEAVRTIGEIVREVFGE